MNIFDENEVSIAGNITFTDFKTGTHGQYGTIGVALYTRKTQNNSDKTEFVNVDVGSSFFKFVNNPQKGDRIALKCRLATQNTEGQGKGKLLLKCSFVKAYLPIDAKKLLQDNGFIKKPQQQGGYQQQAPQQQGGYQQQAPQQQGGYQQQAPQQQGGFQQQAPQQQGGFQQQAPQQQGGFAQQQHPNQQ